MQNFSLSYSPTESNRFGLRVFRGTGWADAAEWRQQAEVLGAELLILRFGAEYLPRIWRQDWAVLRPIVADTLMVYEADWVAGMLLPDLRQAEMVPRIADMADDAAVLALVRASFRGYQNHYVANPDLDPAAALEGMVEWAMTFLDQPQKQTWLWEQDGQAMAMAAFEWHDAQTVEGQLGAVSPEARGQGLYGDIIRWMIRCYAGRGYQKGRVVTQSHNYAVQRTLVREGFVLRESLHTVHCRLRKGG